MLPWFVLQRIEQTKAVSGQSAFFILTSTPILFIPGSEVAKKGRRRGICTVVVAFGAAVYERTWREYRLGNFHHSS